MENLTTEQKIELLKVLNVSISSINSYSPSGEKAIEAYNKILESMVTNKEQK